MNGRSPLPDTKSPGLRFGPISAAAHLCVDMQRIFAEDTPWKMPWMLRVLPLVEMLVGRHPDDTIFTRFIPLQNPDAGVGTWRRYYERWPQMTLDALDPDLLELVAPLASFVPPSPVIDKQVYSPWHDGNLARMLRAANRHTLIITGAETEVCVTATVFGAVDLGYRVVIATDAVCSSADGPHNAMIDIYHSRFGMQIETATTAEILDAWRT